MNLLIHLSFHTAPRRKKYLVYRILYGLGSIFLKNACRTWYVIDIMSESAFFCNTKFWYSLSWHSGEKKRANDVAVFIEEEAE